ncbi:HET-domain-containing protein, partial [Mollisia scopiformis]
MDYKALDLDWNEIRLLTFLPQDADGRIRCRLDHASLINAPAYAALSYCWGDPTPVKSIVINDVEVEIGPNLESALRCLQSRGYDRLWVDAICINQQDNVEKSQQLLWMGSIYRRATRVAAWV